MSTDVAQVGFQLGHTFVLWRVQDNREIRKVLLGLHWIFHPLFGDVADVDQFRRVVQEAAQASQPHQILFVFQLKTQKQVPPWFPQNFILLKRRRTFTSLVISLTW